MLIEQILNKLANCFPTIQIKTDLSFKKVLEIIGEEFKCGNCKHYSNRDGRMCCSKIGFYIDHDSDLYCKYFSFAPDKQFYNAPYPITTPTPTSQQTTSNTYKPQYYKSGEFDVIQFCNVHQLGFCEGNIIKYVVRAGKKDSKTKLEDLNKAKEYLERLIKYYDK